MAQAEEVFAQKFELYGCYQCGKCTGGCPVSLKSRLNIRRLVLEGILGRNIERINERAELWDCTTCKTCTLRCPRGIKPMDLIIGMRSALVEDGHMCIDQQAGRPKLIFDYHLGGREFIHSSKSLAQLYKRCRTRQWQFPG